MGVYEYGVCVHCPSIGVKYGAFVHCPSIGVEQRLNHRRGL